MNISRYNPALTSFAKRLRSCMTLAEVLLWKKLNRSQLGVRFNRQKPIGDYIVDFYCKEYRLAIEIDGDSHNFRQKADLLRQKQLEAQGIRFLRFWDYDVKNRMTDVIRQIEQFLENNHPRPAATPPKEGSVNLESKPYKKIISPKKNSASSSMPRNESPPWEGCLKGGVDSSRNGAALIVVMWVLVIVAIIVSSFAFEMQLEARMISAQRKRFKADQLALAAVELAKSMLCFEEENPADDIVYEDPWMNKAAQVAEGVSVDYSEEFGDGTVSVKIDYEESRRNIRTMTADDWKLLFDQAGIPNTRWDAMLDCLEDWQDENDLHQLNGAESDDPFYRERGYECKNAPVDTVDELMLIKNWGEEVLYGTPKGSDTESPIKGIADQLTTWGSGKVNPSSASAEVLYSLQISEATVEAILELRNGIDGEPGTDDDGLTQADFDGMGLSADMFTLKPEYAAVTASGKVGEVESRISCIFKLGEKEPSPLFWTEGNQAE
jgi:very-short-patch-repair endonuclease